MQKTRNSFWSNIVPRIRAFKKILYQRVCHQNNGQVVIEVSSVCNVRCLWCWMYYFEKKEMGIMSIENFCKVINLNHDFFNQKKITVIPYHRGEPLLHPYFFQMIEYAQTQGIRIGEIHTNLSVPIDINKLAESAIPSIFVALSQTEWVR